jgi:hypothetical protein
MDAPGCGCGCDDFDGPLTLAAPARNHYFYGKLLDEQSFRLEQRYVNAKRWLLNRLAGGGGVLCGLGLTATPAGMLVLAPGALVDGLGREVIVPLATPFDPRQLTDERGKSTGPAKPGPVTVRLAYHPCAADPVPVLVPGCDATRCAMGTVRESFAVLVTQGTPAAPAPAWPPPDLFEPTGSATRVAAADLVAALVGHVTQASPQPPQASAAPVLLAVVTIPNDPNTPVTDAGVSYVGRPVLLSQAELLQLVLALWERVESGLSAASGGKV